MDRSGFAGSVCTADRLIRTMITIGGCTLEQAVKMASANPARVMNVSDRKGTLEVGKDADIVIFDDDINVAPGQSDVNGPASEVSLMMFGCFAITNPSNCGVGLFYGANPVGLSA
jgi:adenine deaminase